MNKGREMSGTAEALPLVVAQMTLPRDPRLYGRDHSTFMRETFGDAARLHHEQHIPRHFMEFAAAKYGYAPRRSVVRKGKGRDRAGRLTYQEWKDGRGLPPLVLTGATRAMVTGSRTITKTQKGAKLKLSLPFSKTGRFRIADGVFGGLTVHQQEVIARIAEISAIAGDESRGIAGFVKTDYTRRANEPGTKYRVRIGAK